MRRGGRRRNWISRGDAAVWCPGGRWGPRRTRVNECWALVRAEDVYTNLLKSNGTDLRAGRAGTAVYAAERRTFSVSWEIRSNAVWRRGRVFLRCARCTRRCTRLYIPLSDSWVACRRCWGLSYPSRALQNYKDSLWGRGAIARMFGTTQRAWAYSTTDENRKDRLRRSRERWADRSKHLHAAQRRNG